MSEKPNDSYQEKTTSTIREDSPAYWLSMFNENEYRSLVEMQNNAPLIPWVEGLAIGLDERRANLLANMVRAGGMVTQQSLWTTTDSDAKMSQLDIVHNYLDFLDRELSGVCDEATQSGQCARVLGFVLQSYIVDQLTK